MSIAIGTFPVSGNDIVSMLETKYAPSQLWMLHRIETLSNGNGELLADLWRCVQTETVQISTSELCTALRAANQVVTLDISLQVDPSQELLIEDGVAVQCTVN